MSHNSPQSLQGSRGRLTGSLDIEPQGATRIMDYPKPAMDVVAPERGATHVMDFPQRADDGLEPSRFARGKTLVMSLPVAQPAPTPVEPVVPEPQPMRQGAVFETLNEGNPTRIVSPTEWLSRPLEQARTGADGNASADPLETNTAPRMKTRPLWSREVAWFKAQSLTRKVSIILVPFAICSAARIFIEAPPAPTPATASRAAVPPAAIPAQVAPKPEQASMLQAAEATEPVTTLSLPVGAQKTLQRQAADALAEGNYATAKALYQTLAAREPNNAAYRAAVRLLDRRLTKRR